MFDYGLAHWLRFGAAAVLLNLSPGPDIAFILGKTAQGGGRAGFAAMAGIWTGALGHVLMAAVGLSALFASSATAFTLVKWIGAAYLIWLGIQALRSDGSGYGTAIDVPDVSLGRTYRQGVLVNLLNPKVAIFFLAFLPQFVVAGQGPVAAQLILHGLAIIAVAALVEPPLVVMGEKLLAKLRRSPKFGLWLDRTLGAVLVTFGLRLAASNT